MIEVGLFCAHALFWSQPLHGYLPCRSMLYLCYTRA
jgi:hypothetical protein